MKNTLSLLFFLTITGIFFGRLFFPEPKLFYTPDYGASDMWHLNYPLKDFLSRSLKHRELPFWSKDIATGSPVFAEGIIGGLYSLNLFFFGLMPTWLAWNLSYAAHFMLALTGSYVFFRHIGFSRFAGLFSAVSFSFGGVFITHLQHFSPVQAAALLPWIFFVADRMWVKPSKVKLLLFALLVSQQIFVGFVQFTYITLIGVFLYLVGQKREHDINELVRKLGVLFLAVSLALALAAPQLLETLALKNQSVRRHGLTSAQIFEYPYPWKHLLTFIWPNAFGTPRDGSYPSPFTEQSIGIYWENTAYVGLLAMLFLAISIFKRRKGQSERSFWLLLTLSILLALGKESPLSFIYSLPGFNYFRVPSRFLLLSSFSLTALAGFGMDFASSILKTQWRGTPLLLPLFWVGVLAVASIDLFAFGYSYHPLVSMRRALEPPPSLGFLPEEERIYTHFSHAKAWNESFFKKGWTEVSDYLYFKNGLDADMNLLFGRESVLVRTAFPSLRQFIQTSLLPMLLPSMSAKYVIAAEELPEGEVLRLIAEIQPEEADLPAYFIYENRTALPRFRLVSRYVVTKTVKEVETAFSQEEFQKGEFVVLETDLRKTFVPPGLGEIKVVVDDEQRIVLQTETDQEALLVIADSFSPSWRAKVNGMSTELLPANINQRAVSVPSGKANVELVYSPERFLQGLVISSLVLFLFGLSFLGGRIRRLLSSSRIVHEIKRRRL